MNGSPDIRSMVVKAARGPIVLITLGTLFAFDHLTSVEFERTWPILIIVIGLMKLLERAVAGNRQSTRPWPNGGPVQ